MADVPGLLENKETGQRYAWSGYDWVPVPRDFDPRESAFVGGLTREINRFGAGIQQLRAAIAGDDAALFSLATEQEMEDWAQVVRSRNAPVAGFLGSAAPYVAAGAAGSGAATALGSSARGAAAAGVATDVALGGLSYGSPGERAARAGAAAAGGAIGAVVDRAFRVAQGVVGVRRGAQEIIPPEVEAVPPGGAALAGGVELPGPRAGGTAVGDEFAESFAGRINERLFQAIRPEETAARLRQTRPLRFLARKHRIKLHPSAAYGSRMLANWEAGMVSDPFSAAPYIRRQGQYSKQLEYKAKAALGLPGWQGPINRDFMRAAEDLVSDGFGEIAENSKPVRVEAIIDDAQKAANENKVGWTKGIEDTFIRQLDLLRREGDVMEGKAAWTMQREFAKEAAEAPTPAMQRMYYSVADAIENQIVEAAEGGVDPAVLQNLRKRYRLIKRLNIRKSVTDADGMKFRSALGAMQDEFDEYRRGHGFEYGAAENALMRPMNDLFEVLRVGQLFQQSVGDSGTATRLAFQNFPSNPLAAGIRQAASEAYYKLADSVGKY